MGSPTPVDSLAIASALCQAFEGFSPTPYLCPAGYWTIGYGTVYKPDGTQVTSDHPPITKEQALQWLQASLQTNYLLGVLRASPCLAGNQEALGALGDFAYNLGVPRYRASTLRRRVEAGDWEEARHELGRWVRAGGRVLPGLVRRRAAERGYLVPG